MENNKHEEQLPNKRNLFIRLSKEKKEELKELAKASGMTMETYTAAVLEDAIKNRDAFTYVRVSRPMAAFAN